MLQHVGGRARRRLGDRAAASGQGVETRANDMAWKVGAPSGVNSETTPCVRGRGAEDLRQSPTSTTLPGPCFVACAVAASSRG